MALNLDSLGPPSKKVKLAGMSICKDQNASVAPMDTSDGQQRNGGAASGRNGVDSASSPTDHSGENVDTNLYSRQIYAIGESAMIKLRKANVLISGLGSVGVEIAKNLILGGVRHVTLHDTKSTTWYDLSAQYYLTDTDIGKNRAESCFQKLAELNDSVECTLLTDELTEEIVSKYDLVILTEASHTRQKQVNQWTRQHGRYFISADARGLFSYSFVDLGTQFRIEDQNGDPCKEVIIEYVDRETGNVMTLEGAFHGFEDGDHVTFSEIKGMTQLNGIEPLKITVVKPNIFNIGKVPEDFGEYIEGCGRARQVKVPSFVDFKPINEALEDPEFIMWDFAHFDAPAQLHALWQALYAFEEKHGRAPAPRSDEDAELLKKELPTGAPEIPEDWLKNFSFQARGNLQPVTSLIGGAAAQEAMKAITHHTTPQKQFLYTHHLEALPGDYSSFDASKLTAEDCAPRNSRYDGQVAVFGWPYQEALFRQRWFVVGAGAIGCELLKNFAMMGVGCGEGGIIKITDMDQIEISNLNRQFLFRRADVGGKKSEVAAKAAKKFNPDLRIEALAERVADDTEEIFNDDFFEDLSGVANALDNVDARRYMDRRCVYYKLPLLESGTMGPKGNTQVVYPNITESYSSTNDPPEKETPSCTLKHFPYEIQHTIQWARAQFEDLFTNPAEKVNKYLADTRGFLSRLEQMHPGERIQDLRIVKQALIDEKPNSAEDCIKWARELFQNNYHNAIAQLLHNFPADQVTSSGSKFWSGTKRCPHVLNFDPNNQFHLDFVYAASILRAEQYNLTPILDRDQCARVATNYQPKPFEPRTGVRIAVTEAEAANENNAEDDPSLDTDDLIDSLKLSLASLQLNDTRPLQMIDFEKDDDTNHHVDWVTAASNLRAWNYHIKPTTRSNVRMVAGRIIPAIATTTAMITGFIQLEVYKYVKSLPLETFRAATVNLATNVFCVELLPDPLRKKTGLDPETYMQCTAIPEGWTTWDKVVIKTPGLTTAQFLEEFKKVHHGAEITSLATYNGKVLYADWHDKKSIDESLNAKLIDLYVKNEGPVTPESRKYILLVAAGANDKDGNLANIPKIQYFFA